MTRHILFSLAACGLLASCETTGNPNQGGLFQWSESKAVERRDDKRDYLDSVEQDTARQRRRSAALEEERERKQRDLNRRSEF